MHSHGIRSDENNFQKQIQIQCSVSLVIKLFCGSRVCYRYKILIDRMSCHYHVNSQLTIIVLQSPGMQYRYKNNAAQLRSTALVEIMNVTEMTSSSNSSDTKLGIERTCFLIRLWTVPLICIIGFVGNSMSIKIFVGKTQRTTSCCVYLATKAVSDNGFLLTLLIAWLDFVDIRAFHIEGICQITLFFSYLCGFMSAWAVVFVTIENYIRVCCPEKVSSYCTPKFARNITITCFFSACIIYSFPLWGTQISVLQGVTFCQTNPEFQNLQLALTYVDSLLTLVLPLLIVPVLVVKTVYSSQEASQRSFRLQQCQSAVTRKRISPHRAVTRLLLTVALVFVFLHTPSHVIRIKVTIEELMKKVQTVSVVDRVLQHLFLTLYHLNYAVNIFIYICCGRRFRTVLYSRLRQLSTKENSQKGRDKASIEELIRISHSFLVGSEHIETKLQPVYPVSHMLRLDCFETTFVFTLKHFTTIFMIILLIAVIKLLTVVLRVKFNLYNM